MSGKDFDNGFQTHEASYSIVIQIQYSIFAPVFSEVTNFVNYLSCKWVFAPWKFILRNPLLGSMHFYNLLLKTSYVDDSRYLSVHNNLPSINFALSLSWLSNEELNFSTTNNVLRHFVLATYFAITYAFSFGITVAAFCNNGAFCEKSCGVS